VRPSLASVYAYADPITGSERSVRGGHSEPYGAVAVDSLPRFVVGCGRWLSALCSRGVSG
jgi:hypothetical protein